MVSTHLKLGCRIGGSVGAGDRGFRVLIQKFRSEEETSSCRNAIPSISGHGSAFHDRVGDQCWCA